MTPFKMQIIDDDVKGDETGTNEMDNVNDKNVELQRDNHTLKVENEALKTQIANLTENILDKINNNFSFNNKN